MAIQTALGIIDQHKDKQRVMQLGATCKVQITLQEGKRGRRKIT